MTTPSPRPDDQPMTVDDIIGIWSPEMLDGLDPVEYVRRLRDEDES